MTPLACTLLCLWTLSLLGTWIGVLKWFRDKLTPCLRQGHPVKHPRRRVSGGSCEWAATSLLKHCHLERGIQSSAASITPFLHDRVVPFRSQVLQTLCATQQHWPLLPQEIATLSSPPHEAPLDCNRHYNAYIYIYIHAVKLLSGPSLGFSTVIIWAKLGLLSGPSLFSHYKNWGLRRFFFSVIILCFFVSSYLLIFQK